MHECWHDFWVEVPSFRSQFRSKIVYHLVQNYNWIMEKFLVFSSKIWIKLPIAMCSIIVTDWWLKNDHLFMVTSTNFQYTFWITKGPIIPAEKCLNVDIISGVKFLHSAHNSSQKIVQNDDWNEAKYLCCGSIIQVFCPTTIHSRFERIKDWLMT